MTITDHEHAVSTQPLPHPHGHDELHRRISTTESHGVHGHDNLAFDSPRSRKVSAASEHADMGPVRKKSILHNAHAAENTSICSDIVKHPNGAARTKKHSVTDSVHSKKSRYSEAEDERHTWWYSICLRCREKEDIPAWQPSVWPQICPHPFCPSYREISRLVAICLIGFLGWVVLYALVGESAAPPRGKLFTVMFLSVSAYLGGWLFSLTTLPPLIGMLFTGLIFQNVGIVNLDESFSSISSTLRKMALVILLIRAGLDLDPQALKRMKYTVPKLGLIPWAVEAVVISIMSHYLLDLPWLWAMAMSSIVAAVSPAVVVACLVKIRAKGYGVAKGIPTLIIAVAGIDDAVSVAVFGVIKSFITSTDSISMQLIHGPMSIIGGIGFGVLWGLISNYIPERHDPFVVPLRIMILFVGGTIAVFGSELIDYEGAGPLGVVTAAFVSIVFWTRQGWDIEDNPATTAFVILWIVFQPILFGLTGAQIKIEELNGDLVAIGAGILAVAFVLRILSTVAVGIGSNLNLKEKLFVALCWMSKATVQAALAPVLLSIATDETSIKHGEVVLMLCILSIMITAPTAAILITLSGPRLLTKTTAAHIAEGWKRSHRPSIRDISIIDEEEERVDHIENGTYGTLSKDHG